MEARIWQAHNPRDDADGCRDEEGDDRDSKRSLKHRAKIDCQPVQKRLQVRAECHQRTHNTQNTEAVILSHLMYPFGQEIIHF